ncbi:MAG: hypothetical protein HY767_01945 [Candidatus Omnitrophica bacterium]|nr:hypothetical protein [Candidatus Omnitrophota bacterium]
MTSHILSWIIFTPLIGAFAILFVPKSATQWIKWIALATTGIVTALAHRRHIDPGMPRVFWHQGTPKRILFPVSPA